MICLMKSDYADDSYDDSDDDHDSWWWHLHSTMMKMTKLTVYYKAGTPSSQHYSPTKLRRRGETKPKGNAYLKERMINEDLLKRIWSANLKTSKYLGRADMQFEEKTWPKWEAADLIRISSDQKLSVACIYAVPLMYFKIRWLLASGCSTGTTSIYLDFSWCQLLGLKSKVLDCW